MAKSFFSSTNTHFILGVEAFLSDDISSLIPKKEAIEPYIVIGKRKQTKTNRRLLRYMKQKIGNSNSLQLKNKAIKL